MLCVVSSCNEVIAIGFRLGFLEIFVSSLHIVL